MKLLVLSVIACAACAGHADTETDVRVSISALSAADVTAVHVTIAGPGMQPITEDLAATSTANIYQGTIGGIPVGSDRVFTGEAVDAGGNVIFRGQSMPVAIQSGAPAMVGLMLTSTAASPPFHNSTPIIDSLYASAQDVVPGGTVTLAVSAHDVDGDPITFNWAGDGTVSPDHVAQTTWTAPSTDGDYNVEILALDPAGAYDTVTVTLGVSSASARGAATAYANINAAPQIFDLTIDGGRLMPGVPTAVHGGAVDPEGDLLAYTWSDDCNGSWSGGDAFPVFTAPTSGVTSCTLHESASDGLNLPAIGDLVVPVGPGAAPNFAPVIDTTFQSDTTAFQNDALQLRATAHDPEGGALTYTWAAATGTLSAETDSATGTQVTWTAPACFPDPGATITLTVTDDVGNTTSTTFTVSSNEHDCTPSGLVAWWTADGTSTDVVRGQPATTFTGSYTAGVRGQAFLFDGTQLLDAPATNLPTGSADRTLEMWVRIDSAASGESFFGGYGAFGSTDGSYATGAIGTTPFFSSWGPVVSGGDIQPGTGFHHVAVTTTGSSASLYVDGVLVASGTVPVATGAGDFFIGRLDSFRAITGAIDEVRVYNRALTAAEIALIAAGQGY